MLLSRNTSEINISKDNQGTIGQSQANCNTKRGEEGNFYFFEGGLGWGTFSNMSRDAKIRP